MFGIGMRYAGNLLLYIKQDCSQLLNNCCLSNVDYSKIKLLFSVLHCLTVLHYWPSISVAGPLASKTQHLVLIFLEYCLKLNYL